MKLKPLELAPRRATLLNTGERVDFAVDLVPSEHVEHKPCLRLRKLPVNQHANTMLVVKLEFDRLPGATAAPRTAPAAGDQRLR